MKSWIKYIYKNLTQVKKEMVELYNATEMHIDEPFHLFYTGLGVVHRSLTAWMIGEKDKNVEIRICIVKKDRLTKHKANRNVATYYDTHSLSHFVGPCVDGPSRLG